VAVALRLHVTDVERALQIDGSVCSHASPLHLLRGKELGGLCAVPTCRPASQNRVTKQSSERVSQQAQQNNKLGKCSAQRMMEEEAEEEEEEEEEEGEQGEEGLQDLLHVGPGGVGHHQRLVHSRNLSVQHDASSHLCS
jgi:hypothetical protein